MVTIQEMAYEPSALFLEIAKKYGLSTPEQIKTRIIWDHVCMVHSEIFASSEQNKKLKEHYRAEFTICEKEEQRIIESAKIEQATL